MKDLIYELASFSLGVAEYLMFDWIEGEATCPESSRFPSCRISDRPRQESSLGLLERCPSWSQRDRHVYP